PASEHDGHDHDVHLVDQVGGQELTDGCDTTTDANVATTGSVASSAEGVLRRCVDEVERRATLHLDRGARMVGQYEDGGVKGRLIAPPALPVVVISPRPAMGTELVPPHDLCADPHIPLAGELVVDVGASIRRAAHRPEGARREEPLVQPVARMSKGRVQALTLTGAESIQ